LERDTGDVPVFVRPKVSQMSSRERGKRGAEVKQTAGPQLETLRRLVGLKKLKRQCVSRQGAGGDEGGGGGEGGVGVGEVGGGRGRGGGGGA